MLRPTRVCIVALPGGGFSSPWVHDANHEIGARTHSTAGRPHTCGRPVGRSRTPAAQGGGGVGGTQQRAGARTAWRLLATLEAHGLVERDGATARYSVGYAAYQLATAEDHDALARRLRPLLDRTAEATGEIVTLAIAKRFGLVYVDQADPPGPASPDWTSRHIPLHATSSGKVFLAWLPDDERAAVLPATLERFTSHTIVDRAALDDELERVRRDGYASCLGEYDYSNGVSAAVFDASHRPVAVVNIWGPSVRVTRARLPSLGRAALRTAHEMSLLLL
jgi:DNA-binding IclR family transcriptional regulator